MSWSNPAGGDWNTPANWLGGVVPNATQDAMINISVSGPITIDSADAAHSLTDTTASLDVTGGSLSLTAASSISQNVSISGGVLASAGNLTVGGTLSESGGNLTGGGTVTVAGLLTWTGGTMSGSGTTLADGGLELGLNDGKSHDESLDARTLQNAGAATWASTDEFSQGANSIFQNLAHATLTVQSGVTWNADGGTLDNQYQATITVGRRHRHRQVQRLLHRRGRPRRQLRHAGHGGGRRRHGECRGGRRRHAPVRRHAVRVRLGGRPDRFRHSDLRRLLHHTATTFDSGSSYDFSGATIIQDGAVVMFDANASTATLDESSGDLGGSAP